MREVIVSSVQVEMPTGSAVLTLLDEDSGDEISLAIGFAEATAISIALEGIIPPRPLTHDLLLTALGTTGRTVSAVRICDLIEGTYYAELVLDNGAVVSSRPSDAVALALRAEAPIYVTEEVFANAAETGDDELAAFREFLNEVTPEDFS